MAFARDVYTATAGQTDFTISYSYEDDEHIEVYQNGTLKTVTTHYTFPNSTTCRLVTGATVGDKIVLQRNTSQSTKLVDFTAGTLTESDLDNAIDQVFYMAQEAIDQVNISLKKATDEVWDATSIRIKNVATPSESTDAVTKAYVDAISAAAGNVPTPGNPADDDKALVASGGTFTFTDLTVATHISDAGTTGKAVVQSATKAAALAAIGHNVTATSAPLVTSDTAAGYTVGSMWFDVTADIAYVCLDATNSNAVWKALGANVGEIRMHSVASAPSGWLNCDGAAVSRTTYADLFAVVSTTYGVGDGSTTFNLPDFKGRSPLGIGQGAATAEGDTTGTDRSLADKVGYETHTLTTAELASHAHTAGSLSASSGGSHTHTVNINNSGAGTGIEGVGNSAASVAATSTSSSHSGHTHSISGSAASAGSDNAHANMHPSLAVNFIIKY